MDEIQRIIKGFGDIAAHLMGKENPANEIIIYDQIESSHELYKVIFQLLEKGDICKAENVLFNELARECTEAKFAVGEEFYRTLSEYPDKKLQDANFSREEIEQGKKDMQKFNWIK